MKRLEVKENNSYNFTTVMKGEFSDSCFLFAIIMLSLTCLAYMRQSTKAYMIRSRHLTIMQRMCAYGYGLLLTKIEFIIL